jgi:hypothetical protein
MPAVNALRFSRAAAALIAIGSLAACGSGAGILNSTVTDAASDSHGVRRWGLLLLRRSVIVRLRTASASEGPSNCSAIARSHRALELEKLK